MLQTYLNYYTAHFKTDVQAVFKYGGQAIDPKYNAYVNRAMRAAAAAIAPKETRLLFQQRVAPELIGGLIANIGGDTIDETHAIQIASLAGEAEEMDVSTL